MTTTANGTNQPDAAPQDAWVPRTDAGARKLIQRVDDLRKEMRAHITHAQALGAILAALGVLGGAMAWTLSESKTHAQAVRSELHHHEEAHRGEVKDLKNEVREGRNDVRQFMRHMRPGLPEELTRPLPGEP